MFIDSTLWLLFAMLLFARSPGPLLLFVLFKIKLRRRKNGTARASTTPIQAIILNILQIFFIVLFPLLFPLPFTSLGLSPVFGGLRKLPPPSFIIDVPRDSLLFRRKSPCCNFGGRRACSELIIFVQYRTGVMLAAYRSMLTLYKYHRNSFSCYWHMRTSSLVRTF